MKPITIHPQAEAEVAEATAYYEGKRTGLGWEFVQDFEETIARIQAMPEAPPPLDDRGTRKLRFLRFPYTVYYVDIGDSLWIAAVAHQNRRPRYWSDREP